MKKLLLITACFFGLSSQTHAQIFYQDYLPDSTINSYAEIVIANTIKPSSPPPTTFYGVLVIWQHGSTLYDITSSSDAEILAASNKVTAVNIGDAINMSGSWKVMTTSHGTTFNDWPNGTEKCIGVRFKKGGTDYYYGWIRAVKNSNSFTLKDYAYNTIPGGSIKAGQTANTGINEAVIYDNIAVYPNPSNNCISVDVPTKDCYSYYIYDAGGKLMQNGELVNSNKIDVSRIPSGNYSIIISSKELLLNAKFIVQ